MKKKILLMFIIILIIIIFGITYFIIKYKITEETVNNKILKIFLDEGIGTGTYLNRYYYISKDKENVVIEEKSFSEMTGKYYHKTKTKKIDKLIIEEYIKKLEEYVESNTFEKNTEQKTLYFNDKKMPDIKYPKYHIEYKNEEIIVQKDYNFFQETEEFLKKIDE